MKSLFLVGTLLVAGLAFGHADHEHQKKMTLVASCKEEFCKELELTESAQSIIDAVIKADERRAGWEKAKLVKVEEGDPKNVKDWKLSYSDEKKSKAKILYVFVTVKGYLNGSNFSGK
ncbi:MAG: hypothetical protein B7Y39_04290 [Bdellovibrio sp. 28-41-41]|nr:MAG: hypothetical protein B7Y39_04290 [Bdellovibrio sp. 28-41-41]